LCVDEAKDFTCKKRKCKKYSDEKKEQCKKTCDLCEGLPPSAPPSCEDNNIPGLGSFWCNLNTSPKHHVTDSAKEDFCNNEVFKNKCLLSCGEC
jgi:hypothetical protein